jgi:hypothetical protein
MKSALRVSGVIFALVSIGHVLRLVFNIKVVAGTFTVPMSISVAGAIVALLLAAWMFKAAK